MQKNRIAIASVLKPVKDPRAYYRFGISLRETNKYQINIIGFSTKSEPSEGDIHFHAVFSKKRTNPKRIWVFSRLFQIIWRIRPQLLIVTTFEMLPVAVLGKWIFRYKLVYDVQENYVLNIGQNATSSGISNWFARAIVRFFESSSRRFIDHFFFAERCYVYELPKFRPATILENCFFSKPAKVQPYKFDSQQVVRFLISGTITEVYGALTGVQWFKELKKHMPNSELHVIGHCPMDSYREKIEGESPLSGLTLELDPNPIPYQKILEAYGQANVVLMPYRQIDSIREKMPSKIYESLALGKVCLFSPNSKWEEMVASYGAGFSVDFEDFSAIPTLISNLYTLHFFTKNPDIRLTWKSQEGEFLDTISSLLK